MGDWLKTHAYIATWCSPLLTLIGLRTRAPKNRQTGEVDWLSIVLYVVLLSLLAAAISPVEQSAGWFARATFGMVLIFVVFRDRR